MTTLGERARELLSRWFPDDSIVSSRQREALACELVAFAQAGGQDTRLQALEEAVALADDHVDRCKRMMDAGMIPSRGTPMLTAVQIASGIRSLVASPKPTAPPAPETRLVFEVCENGNACGGPDCRGVHPWPTWQPTAPEEGEAERDIAAEAFSDGYHCGFYDGSDEERHGTREERNNALKWWDERGRPRQNAHVEDASEDETPAAPLPDGAGREGTPAAVPRASTPGCYAWLPRGRCGVGHELCDRCKPSTPETKKEG